MRQDISLALFLGLFGVAAAYLSVNIPHTEVFVEGRAIFWLTSFVLIRRIPLVLAVAVALSLAGFHKVPLYVAFFGNLFYALPFGFTLRFLHGRWFSRIDDHFLYCVTWFLAVLVGYQLFCTPIVWGVLGILRDSLSFDFVAQSWVIQPYFFESVAVGLISALGMTIFRIHTMLREREERLATILRSIGDAVISTDTGGRVEFMNPVAEQLTGWGEEQARGRPLDVVFHIVNGTTRETCRNPVDQVLEQGIVVGLANHTVLISRHGSEAQIADSGAPVRDASGTITGVVLVFRDVTEEYAMQERIKESEERWQFALQGSRDGVWDWNPETGGVYFSPRWKQMLGYGVTEIDDDISEWEGRIHPEDKSRVFADLEAHLRGESPHYENEHRLRCRDGSYVWILDRGMVVSRDAQGKTRRVIGTHTDISDRKRDEACLVEAKEAAEAADRAKSRFLANMSHEFRTPLNGMMGMMQLVHRTSREERTKSLSDHAIRSCRRLTQLLNDILDTTRIESGTLDDVAGVFDPREVMTSVLELFRPSADQSGLALDIVCDDRVPRQVMGEEAHLRRILFHLVGNAVKFTPSGRVLVEASSLPETKEGTPRLLFVVEDTGIGMDEGVQRRIFTPFSQGEEDMTRSFQGAGLGLSIVAGVVRRMGGEICVDSQTKEGAAIGFTFPVAAAVHAKEDSTVRKMASMENGAFSKEASKHLLVVEDDEANLMALSQLLEGEGFKTSAARTGEEAVSMAAQKSFDLILMDIQLPGMDGVQAMEAIRARPECRINAKTPVVALTAYAMTGDRERFMDAGMEGYLAKPVLVEDLHKKIGEIISTSPET